MSAAALGYADMYCMSVVTCVFWCFIRGQSPGEIEVLFLEAASKLDTYGVDPHPVKVRISEKFVNF